jgi:selenocysteine-specific elongation factor
MRGLILGTAGHIDHGKSALVEALTGVDPDRLQEEKVRGITIELGFAELDLGDDLRFGVVDVPGHEAFVRAMVAGAAGVDVVLLVVAADEGVMPQTREHLAIVELLGVPRLVVAVTKCDLVEDDWLELVSADVDEVLEGTPYSGAEQVRTSAARGEGLDGLRDALRDAASGVRNDRAGDLVRLPLDRVFTIRGTGTVGTGTLWSGSLAAGDKVRLLPQDLEARVRSVQVHGRDVDEARAGDRTAVGLAGAGADRDILDRGATLVTSPHWATSHVVTARVRMLPSTEWMLQHNQRVHVHHGTSEVLARCALLEAEPLGPGQVGWVQLRLEEPLAVRARDRFVIRAYSPVTTIGGGMVAEPVAPKRRGLEVPLRAALDTILDGDGDRALVALLAVSEWSGVERAALPVRSGLSPVEVERALASLEPDAVLESAGILFGAEVSAKAQDALRSAVDDGHRADSLRGAIPLAEVRTALPSWAPTHLADAALRALVASGELEQAEGGVRRPGHRPELTAEQADASAQLESLLREGGLAAPFVDEFPEELGSRRDLRPLLRRLEELDVVCQVADGFFVPRDELDAAAGRIAEQLGGRIGLGPADFREALPVSRKWLLPLLNYFDGRGVTVRRDTGRDVPSEG